MLIILKNPLSEEETKSKLNKGEYVRAYKYLLCPICNKKYILHPYNVYAPDLNELCDGTLVKL